jgi:hypothetical protein
VWDRAWRFDAPSRFMSALAKRAKFRELHSSPRIFYIVKRGLT